MMRPAMRSVWTSHLGTQVAQRQGDDPQEGSKMAQDAVEGHQRKGLLQCANFVVRGVSCSTCVWHGLLGIDCCCSEGEKVFESL